MIAKSQAEEALSQVTDPALGHNLVELGTIDGPQHQLLFEGRAAVRALDGREKGEIELAEVSGEERQEAQHLGIPMLGVADRMSNSVAPDTGQRCDIFGLSHARDTQSVGRAFARAVAPGSANSGAERGRMNRGIGCRSLHPYSSHLDEDGARSQAVAWCEVIALSL